MVRKIGEPQKYNFSKVNCEKCGHKYQVMITPYKDVTYCPICRNPKRI